MQVMVLGGAGGSHHKLTCPQQGESAYTCCCALQDSSPTPCADALQISHRTRWLVTHDWLRNAVFGRNISDI